MRLKVRGHANPVRISAPDCVTESVIYEFVERNLDWIAHKQAQLSERTHKQLHYEAGEIHPLWGEPKILKLESSSIKSGIFSTENSLDLHAKNTITSSDCQRQLERFYRQEMQAQLPALLCKWQPIIGRSVNECRIKKMRTRWGTCNIGAKRVWLSLELAKKPLSCLEYVLVHEMVHLHERNHTKRFYQLMAAFLPDWQDREISLNQTHSLGSEC